MAKALTHVDRAWEDLALSEDGEPIVEVRNVVLCYIFVRVNWLVALSNYKHTANPPARVDATLTCSITLGSYFAVRNEVVELSTVLKILLRMNGLEEPEMRRY